MSYLFGRLTTDPDQRSGAIDLAERAGLRAGRAGPGCRGDRQLGHPLPRLPGLLHRAAGAAAARRAASRQPRRAHLDGCRPVMPSELAPGAGTWRLLVLAALLDEPRRSPARAHRPGRLPVPRRPGTPGPPDPQRAWSALLALERAGLWPSARPRAGRVGEPGAAGGGPRCRTAGTARPGGPGGGGRAGSRRGRRTSPARGWPRRCGRARPACGRPPGTRCGPAAAATGCCWRPGSSLAAAGLAGPAVAWWRELTAGCQRILGPGPPGHAGGAAACWPTRCWRPGRRPRP